MKLYVFMIQFMVMTLPVANVNQMCEMKAKNLGNVMALAREERR